jgi:catechol 2,3-dioxygenase-like lactoylglutathione lyase family enzyme
MRIRQVALTVNRLDETASFYREVLLLPVTAQARRTTVTVGSSRLVLEPGDPFPGVHHLAFGVAPADFQRARTWLGERVEPIVVDGSEVVEGPEGWHSQSVYFLGPEGIVLELIARQADREIAGSTGDAVRLLCISEVGVGVPDVGEGVHALTRELGVPAFPPQGTHFAPVGGHDGLVILVDEQRIWFPTDTQRAAQGPVVVELEAPLAARLSLRPTATVLAS